MRQNCTKWLLLVLALLSLHAPAFADEVKIKNGDRITGNIVKLKNGLLTIETRYAGTIGIRWEEVESLRADKTMKILLKDESVAGTVPRGAEGGAGKLLTTDGTSSREVNLSEVAAINPDQQSKGVLYSGRVNAGASVTDGNTNKSAFSSDGEIVARKAADRWTFGWQINQEKTEGRKTADHESGYVKYDYFITPKWYALVNVAAERDTINDLDLRIDSGVGTGYQFIDTDTDKLSAEIGISQVSEDFSQAANPEYLAQRWAVNANFQLGETGTEFFHQHDGLLSFENIENLIIRSVTGIRMPIYSQLSSSVQIRWNWENSPAQGLRNSDVSYMLMLGYKF